MATLGNQLDLQRCPHCNVDQPNLVVVHQVETFDYASTNRRMWRFYKCGRCGGIVTAAAPQAGLTATEVYPGQENIDGALPTRARAYLQQALDSLHAPAGAVMLAASAVDAMLKEKQYVEGSLYKRIDKAAADHLITAEMARWAHEVRLDANDQRHADQAGELPTAADARRSVDFARALGEFMFVLPARVSRGVADASGGQ